MRLYGKKFIANRTEARIQDRKESRDSVVYDIDETNKFCRVRVAGTDILVRAWFPNNFMRSPQWLKVGTAVRIAHVGGDKSRIEVVSPGLVQPTFVMSPMMGGVDAIMIGMDPTATGTSWLVSISTGTYRINGVLFSFAPGGPTMDNENWHMGDGGDMSGTYWWRAVDPISAHDEGELWFRYDAFMIGTDGVVDYVKGEEWQWEGVGGDQDGPLKPDVPVDHVLIREYILVWSGQEEISQQNIGQEWEAPHPESLVVTQAYSEPFWEPAEGGYARSRPGIGVIYGGPNTYVPAGVGSPNRGAIQQDMQASANVTVMDQYGQPFSYWSSGSINYLELWMLGTGAYGGYGDISVGFGEPVAAPTDESGAGPVTTVNMGLGSTIGISYVRKHSTIEQSDPEVAGYPSYEQADADSHTAILFVQLISPDNQHPVSAMIDFWNLDAAGNPQ